MAKIDSLLSSPLVLCENKTECPVTTSQLLSISREICQQTFFKISGEQFAIVTWNIRVVPFHVTMANWASVVMIGSL